MPGRTQIPYLTPRTFDASLPAASLSTESSRPPSAVAAWQWNLMRALTRGSRRRVLRRRRPWMGRLPWSGADWLNCKSGGHRWWSTKSFDRRRRPAWYLANLHLQRLEFESLPTPTCSLSAGTSGGGSVRGRGGRDSREDPVHNIGCRHKSSSFKECHSSRLTRISPWIYRRRLGANWVLRLRPW